MNEIPYGYCHCGCGQKTNIAKVNCTDKKWTKGQPLKFIRGHRTKSPTDYIIDPKTGCWVWQKATTDRGYGTVSIKGRSELAHRYYYRIHKGEIPRGLILDHLCKNPSCVNPDHLDAVACAENVRRGLSTKLSEAQVKEIRTLDKGGMKQCKIALIYGIHPSHISRIVNYQAWR